MKQERAIELALDGHNIFLTGNAGTGKTYTLNIIVEKLKERDEIVAKTASTGIASTHIDGQTIHSWSGTGIKEALIIDDLKKIDRNPFSRDRILHTDVLIVDEISMLKGIKLNVVDQICKFVKKNSKPFGGIQVIVSGDFFQLPPVDPSNRTNKNDYCFKAKSWQDAGFKVCYLDKIYRQSDSIFIDLLNSIRDNNVSEDHVKLLNSLSNNKKLDDATKLFCKNVNVDIINSMELRNIDSEPSFFEMESGGNEYAIKTLKKNCTAPETLILKIGARVMFLKNDFERGIVNGTQGEIIKFDTYTKYNKDGHIVDEWDNIPYVKIFKEDRIEPAIWEEWKIEEFNPLTKKDEKKAWITQIPLKLSWALTIHKSQGATFNYIDLDLSDVFEKGMGYVALSRATELDGIHLSEFNQTSLMVDDEVIQKNKEFLEESRNEI